MSPANLLRRNFACSVCRSNTSYPELFFIAYLEAKGIEYEYQVKFDDSQRKIDFYIPSLNVYVETHGRQHYITNEQWHKTSEESDKVKRQHAKKNNIVLIELDCRESSFEFIKDNINKNELLPSIDIENEKRMLMCIESNKRYPVKEIAELYNSGVALTKIMEKFGIKSPTTVYTILNNHGVRTHKSGRGSKKQIRCIETMTIYNSLSEAERDLKCHGIAKCAKGKQKTAGGYHWEYVS